MKTFIGSWKKLWQDLGTRRWIFLFLVGILLVVPVRDRFEYGQQESVSETEVSKDSETEGDGVSMAVSRYEADIEHRLAVLLQQIEGAGTVQVMVTVSRSSELILQTDTSREEYIVRETDSQGGTRDNRELQEDSQTVLTGGSGTSQPYVIGEIMPKIEGVVVACEGGDHPAIQAEISAAVQALFDLAPHKIKVCKMALP